MLQSAVVLPGSAIGRQDQANEVRQASGVQLLEHARAMHFDRARAGEKRLGDLFGGAAAHEQIEYFVLARSEQGQALTRLCGEGLALANLPALFERTTYGAKKLIVSEGFFQKVDRASLHGAHGDRDIRLTGHDDDGQTDAFLVQPPLEFKAIHPRHADIRENAAARLGGRRQQCRCTWVGADREAGRLEQGAQCITDGSVIIHDMDRFWHPRAMHRQYNPVRSIPDFGGPPTPLLLAAIARDSRGWRKRCSTV